MTATYLPALAALAGSVLRALTSFMTTWLTQRVPRLLEALGIA